MDNNNLLEVKNLKKYFPVKSGMVSRSKAFVKAVDGISFSIKRKETLGLVGESGCGKTTAGRTIIRLIEPTEGDVVFDGKKIYESGGKDLRALRRHMQIIFQDPFASLNPRLTVGATVAEPLAVHGIARGAEKKKMVREILERVGLSANYVNRYPHEFSGGQRQRIGIARALALKPRFIVCDEPVSALDVSIQAQIINLLEDLQEEFELSYLFIAHDLSVVKHISDRVGVMYLGKMMELAPSDELYDNPLHPYTQALLSAAPVPDPKTKLKRLRLPGDVPSPINPPSGCSFHTRCKYAHEICKKVAPQMQELTPNHFTSCHMAAEHEEY
jgi:peptide/nickel transport system ATP-binding protein